jgi:diaminopimelate epimerase
MKIEFYKYQGTGNDFVIVDNRSNEYANLTSKQVKHICDRNFGVGADGLMLLGKKEGYDFEMIYYNSDGNQSTMCGNGGRCLVQFAYHRGIKRSTYNFIAIDGDHKAEIDGDGTVSLQMQNVDLVNYHNSYAIINTGSPHFVKFDNKVKNIDVPTRGHEIRYSKEFAEKGINVNFVESTGEDSIFVRTYERGVENETLSCGTGVTAAALLSAHNEKGFNTVRVKTLGGNLSVEFNKIDDQHFDNIWLCGPAELVYTGVIELDS